MNAGITLSPDQTAARDAIHVALREGQPVVMLAGAAGCGKTTLLRVLLDDFDAGKRRTVLLAPTGKAASRMGEATGRAASTIHSALYGAVWEDDDGEPRFSQPGAVCQPGDLVIIDEASMLGSRTWGDLRAKLPDGAQVLAVGDPFQLRPVRDTPAFALERAAARLTRVHRQAAENPILAYATALRDGTATTWVAAYGDDDPRLRFRRATVQHAADVYHEVTTAGADVTMLTWMRRDRLTLCREARTRAGVTWGVHVVEGDTLLCRVNRPACGIFNGETFRVEHVAPAGTMHGEPMVEVRSASHPTRFRIAPSFLYDGTVGAWRRAMMGGRAQRTKGGRPPAVEQLHAWHGQALTVHAAQGSQWSHVVGYIPARMRDALSYDRADTMRLLYTLVTRAADRLTLVIDETF